MTPPAFLKIAVRDAIRASGGIEAVAAALGYSKTHVGRWNSLADRDLPSDELRIALDELAMAGGARAAILEAYARQLGHVAFRLPEGFGETEALTVQLGVCAREFGDIAGAVVEAVGDGDVNARESQRIVAEIDDAMNALVKMRALLVEEEPRVPQMVVKVRGL